MKSVAGGSPGGRTKARALRLVVKGGMTRAAVALKVGVSVVQVDQWVHFAGGPSQWAAGIKPRVGPPLKRWTIEPEKKRLIYTLLSKKTPVHVVARRTGIKEMWIDYMAKTQAKRARTYQSLVTSRGQAYADRVWASLRYDLQTHQTLTPPKGPTNQQTQQEETRS